MAKQNCTKNDTQKTATGYVTDSVCSFNGTTMTSHSEVTGRLQLRLFGQGHLAQ